MLKTNLNEKQLDALNIWLREYKNYLNNNNEFHIIHADLWYENCLLDNQTNQLTAVLDWENLKIGTVAEELASVKYLGEEFLINLLKTYKGNYPNIEKDIQLQLVKGKIVSYKSICENEPEDERLCHLVKITTALE